MRVVCRLFPVFLLFAGPVSAAELAQSCTDLFSTWRFTGKVGSQTLLVVLNDKLVDAADATLQADGTEYEFYYVYKSPCSAETPCVAQPIIAVKTARTAAPAPPAVFLSRAGMGREWSVGKDVYDQFHNADETSPPNELSRFHYTYYSSSGDKLHTNYPKERRRPYLFAATTGSPWFKARHYSFVRTGLLQCIRFTTEIQSRTTSALVEVVEIEDGRGGVPQRIQQWQLKLGTAR